MHAPRPAPRPRGGDEGRRALAGSSERTARIAGILRRRLLRQRIVFFLAQIRDEDLLTLKDWAESGQLRPVIDRTYTLEQAPAAISYAEKQQVRGKVVLTIAHPGHHA